MNNFGRLLEIFKDMETTGATTELNGYVGFDSITSQIQSKFLKRGFQLNIMLVGESGLGKSTFINTLFNSKSILSSKGRKLPGEPIPKTTTIQAQHHDLIENGVKLRLCVVDTPGYADHVNNNNCWEPIISYIKDHYGTYLKKELTASRERFIDDSRIHCCLFFINPTGHSLKPIDIVVLKKLSLVVNVIPVIAKSDSLTNEEKEQFKNRIKQELEFHEIQLYPYASPEDDEKDMELNQKIQDMIPFAIVGSTETVEVDGKVVRGRNNRCGIVNIEDETHCEFVYIRNMLTKTHLQDLIETTQYKHYESFRCDQIMAFSNSNRSPPPQQQQGKHPNESKQEHSRHNKHTNMNNSSRATQQMRTKR